MGLGSLLLAVAWLASAQDNGRFRFTAGAGRLTALSADAMVTWKVDLADARVPVWRVDRSCRVVVVDGAIVTAQGALLARGPEPEGLSPSLVAEVSADLSAWDPLAEVTQRSVFFTSPLFDSLGNAWVMLTDGLSLQAVRSNGHTGTWGAATTVIPRDADVFGLEAIIDAQDRITVAFRSIVGVSYQLRAIRYDPQRGWGDAEVIHATRDSGARLTAVPQDEAHGRLRPGRRVGHLPCHCGRRFSAKARGPSLESSVRSNWS